MWRKWHLESKTLCNKAVLEEGEVGQIMFKTLKKAVNTRGQGTVHDQLDEWSYVGIVNIQQHMQFFSRTDIPYK